MKKSLFIVYAFLLFLTIFSALIATSRLVSTYAVFLIMGLSAFKFLLVAFQFMDVKKANSFWKISLTMTLGLIVLLVVLLK